MREIIFDTETTGLSAKDGDRVIEIGAVEMMNGFPTGVTFHEYLNPGERKIHPDAEAIHGISNAQLEDKPSFKDILPKFLEFFSDGNLVAHNATFDMGFLNAEMERVGEQVFDPDRVVDTLIIARRKHPAGPNSLDALCKRYGVSNAHRKLHGALLDSEILAEVYLELTGGRQAGLGLDAETEIASQQNMRLTNTNAKPQKQRETALPSRLSEAELAAHIEFEASLGDASIWKKWDKPN